MNIKSKKGMTLVEVIATVTIMAIIMIPISLIFSTAYSNFITESDKSTAQKSARAVLYGKGLYDNGLISYGVIGDLQRSNVGGSNIQIVWLDPSNHSKGGREIIITDDSSVVKTYRFDGTTLMYSDSVKVPTAEDYFKNETSSNGKFVIVKDFNVLMIEKGENLSTGIKADCDLIKVSVKVECGKSGVIELESSYRIPIE